MIRWNIPYVRQDESLRACHWTCDSIEEFPPILNQKGIYKLMQLRTWYLGGMFVSECCCIIVDESRERGREQSHCGSETGQEKRRASIQHTGNLPLAHEDDEDGRINTHILPTSSVIIVQLVFIYKSLTFTHLLWNVSWSFSTTTIIVRTLKGIYVDF